MSPVAFMPATPQRRGRHWPPRAGGACRSERIRGSRIGSSLAGVSCARTPVQVYEECVYQIGALLALAQSFGMKLRHVKPHGALYNMACRDDEYALGVVEAVHLFGLTLLGLPQSQLEALSAGRCPFIAEGFADRRYQPDGSLVPRSQPHAFVEDADEAVRQAEWLVRDKGVRTLCVHGDNPQALVFVRELRGHFDAKEDRHSGVLRKWPQSSAVLQ